MSTVDEREIRAQQRVVAFFKAALGYAYLGDWKDRDGNSNVEETLLADWLSRQGHSDKIIAKVLFELGKAAALGGSKTLYDANREVYGLLRYGVRVQPDVGEQNVTVWLIDWADADHNDFGIAEEVTVDGENTKRPDLVLYVNGIAVGVLELKRSTVSVSEGIRQNLDNQKKAFIERFFTTVQLVMAGNDTEGLRYGVIETPEKYWLRWKEAEAHPVSGDNPLLRELSQLCGKERLLEVVHDFVVFDAGVKKICRHNQYFGVRAAQTRVQRREGGIIWHTLGARRPNEGVPDRASWLALNPTAGVPQRGPLSRHLRDGCPCKEENDDPTSTGGFRARCRVAARRTEQVCAFPAGYAGVGPALGRIVCAARIGGFAGTPGR